MGTRGAFGFRIDGADKVMYNHFDSYPSGLGQDIIDFLREVRQTSTPEELATKVRAIRLVDGDSTPDGDDVLQYKQWADTGISSGSLSEWYVLLRKLQGSPQNVLEAGVMVDSQDFLLDSLFCEWAYIVNLDSECLEVYRGFQREPHDAGRYAHRLDAEPEESASGRKYYPVALLATIPFSELPDTIEKVIQWDDDADGYVVVGG